MGYEKVNRLNNGLHYFKIKNILNPVILFL